MKNNKIKMDSENIAGYLFIAPWLIGFILLTIIPILSSFYFSFTDFNLLNDPNWIGLDNYKRMFFEDSKFWNSLKTTFLFVGASIPLRLIFALFIAMVLNRKHRFIGFYRTAYYLPSIIGGSVAVAVMWKQLFGLEGAINAMLSTLGIEGISWLGNPKTAIWTLVLLMIWQFGSPMLIFLAGLKNIPESYYEAAVIDGATSIQKFRYITIPLLSPVILFNLVMQTINGFMSFNQSYIITEGGPLDSTLVYALYLYRRAFEFYDMGFSSGMAWFMLLIIAGLTALIFKTSKHWVYYEAKGDI